MQTIRQLLLARRAHRRAVLRPRRARRPARGLHRIWRVVSSSCCCCRRRGRGRGWGGGWGGDRRGREDAERHRHEVLQPTAHIYTRAHQQPHSAHTREQAHLRDRMPHAPAPTARLHAHVVQRRRHPAARPSTTTTAVGLGGGGVGGRERREPEVGELVLERGGLLALDGAGGGGLGGLCELFGGGGVECEFALRAAGCGCACACRRRGERWGWNELG